MTPALIVVDMINDNVHGPEHLPITAAARAIVPRINRLLAQAHAGGWPVVFACDSFLAEDRLLRDSRLAPHALRGTAGAEPIPELDRLPGDHVLAMRRLSAFFKTDLDQTLRTCAVDTVLVCGLTTPFCVLATALDAVSHDFAAIIVEDCCVAARAEQHEAVLGCYRKSALGALLQLLPLERALTEVRA